MSSSQTNPLFSALDIHTPKQLGENGHVEYTWSHDESELINQLYFQLVRAKSQNDTKDIRKKLESLIIRSKPTASANQTSDIASSNFTMLSLLYKLIGHTRDVEAKGERQLAYAQLWVWHKHFPELAKFAFKTFVYFVDEDGSYGASSKHQYGSWNDVKYMCGAFKELGGGNTAAENHPMINYAIKLMVEQLTADISKHQKKESHISLAARHAPRENSRFGWVFNKMSDAMFPYIATARTVATGESAKRKARMHMRNKILSPLNKQLDTVQIKMAAGAKGVGEWDKINFNNVTSKTMRQHSKAWQNITKTGETRSSDDNRVACASNYKGHIERALRGDKTAKVHGKRCNTYELVRDAVIGSCGSDEKVKTDTDRINLQWKSNSKQNSGLGNMIAIADVSGSMTIDDSIPLYNSIGLSIRVSEKASPAFKDRIITFSETPTWVKLDGDKTFCEKVNAVKCAPWGMTTNLHTAFQMILDGIREADMAPIDVENMAIIVFSDMQINCGSRFNDTAMESIIRMFTDAGNASKYSTPYPTPHLVWWNLRKTTGFPSLSTMKNTTMLSGYNAALLNAFESKGVEALKEYTPVKMIHDILCAKRYNMLNRHILQYFE
jgi:hypothetical protein